MPQNSEIIEAADFEKSWTLDDVSQKRVGMSLSGGGFKAALYHLGALWRLNEAGVLGKIDRFSSVSGGSITAALLGLNWNNLNFEEGVGTKFETLVFQPLVHFCFSQRLDVQAGLGGVFDGFESAADKVAKAYDKDLFAGATLQELPDESSGPRFTICATNAQLNSLVRMNRSYLADNRVGLQPNPTLKLAKAVAASSAFPPFLSPMVLDFPQPIQTVEGADMNLAPYNERLELIDGGVYDNMGLEPLWKRCGVLLISNAGNHFADNPNPPNDWLAQLQRTITMIHRQAENNRIRSVMALALAGKRTVALWNLRGDPVDGRLALTPQERAAVNDIKVRLWPPTKLEASLLLRHGYAMADGAITSFWVTDTAIATQFPQAFSVDTIAQF
jgi:NTE family protein